MEGLRPDHWQHISTFLTIRELCKLMCVSRTWFHFWIDDRYWLYQEQRICFHFPELQSLFEKNRPSKETRKKRKTEWTMPRKGTWWVFKRWLYLGINMGGFKELCRDKTTHPLAMAVVSLNIPCRRELISEPKIIPNQRKGGPGYSMYRVCFWTPGAHHPGNRTTFIVRHGSNYFDHEFYYIQTGKLYDEINERRESGLFNGTSLFAAWRSLLFQEPNDPCWTDLFVKLIQNTLE